MRVFQGIILSLSFLIFISCGTSRSGKDNIFQGTIEPAGITTYQYGTHRLQTENTFYALKSDSVKLEEYEGQKVRITASKIEGYPVDGGPVYLLVTKVMKE